MENLISLIVDLISALLGKSKEGPERGPVSPVNRPDPSRPRPTPRPTSWEDELRRLLEGQGQAAPATPPPIQRPQPTLVPPAPRVVAVQPRTPVPDENFVRIYPTRPSPVLTPPPLPAGIEMGSRNLASLSESKQAYARASQLDVDASARIERVTGTHVQSTAVIRKQASPEITQVYSLFKSSRGVRQAVIASIILGPPRALDEYKSSII